MEMTKNTPSARLATTFAEAKKVALDGEFGKVTVLGVSLVDVEMIERGKIVVEIWPIPLSLIPVSGISRTGWHIYLG